jgi:hypothetical protein
MLMMCFLAAAGVLGIMALHSSTERVQITIVWGCVIALLGFFVAAVLVIARLGVFALLDNSQVIAYAKQENAAKNRPEPPIMPPALDPRHPNPQLPLPEEES